MHACHSELKLRSTKQVPMLCIIQQDSFPILLAINQSIPACCTLGFVSAGQVRLQCVHATTCPFEPIAMLTSRHIVLARRSTIFPSEVSEFTDRLRNVSLRRHDCALPCPTKSVRQLPENVPSAWRRSSRQPHTMIAQRSCCTCHFSSSDYGPEQLQCGYV
jgi:hypothetical protein